MKFKQLDQMGVLVLMSHLIITVLVLAIYGYTLHTGQGDETLKTILTVIIGYWFGSMGAASLRRPEAKVDIEVKDNSKGA